MIERKTGEYLAGLRKTGDLDALGEALAQSALRLARTLDVGPAQGEGTIAATARELRATLVELAPKGGDDGDSDPFAQWERSLGMPSEIRHPEE